MSREKQCECCHEWWYDSDVKEDLCPNCYYYFKRLKQQLKEYKNKENTSAVNSWDEMLKNCENCGLNECIGCEYTQTCVQNIKQQLAEKQNTIDEINKEFVQAVHDWKVLCAEKDKNFQEYRNEVVSNIEKEVYERMRDTVKEYEMQLAEKDEEIERLKNLFELNNEVVINQGKEIFDLRVQVLQQKQNQTQLAIQELEKVKILTEWKFESIADVVNQIDQQIKELKGEKDIED